MDTAPPSPSSPHLEWSNVGFGFAFIALDMVLSQVLQLQIGTSLVISALRCIVQLTLVATVLQSVFASQNMWTVAAIALLLNMLGTFEAVMVKAERRCRHMIPIVFLAMVVSTVPTSILGGRFAMSVSPFWTPDQYIPVLGMLCGNAIAGISVALSYVLKELDENRDKTETYLAFGASRFEACRPLIVEALRLSLMPVVNQMSVTGIIAIPGMMSGAILGGADVQQAARLQMIIMFMIAASSALACIVATFLALSVCVDSEHRIRSERIDKRSGHALRRTKSGDVGDIAGAACRAWTRLAGCWKHHRTDVGNGNAGEHAPLLG
ncbi:hypothetical protein EDB86DRAFT_2967439 [Lactarius hatsudake]|nr:hypothetical protein EDB86DRAFT_3024020 [Lactarius hatsudake]KAH8983426.1 hypothetical protein EDB86DRAFT_2967439 [Lactarius hatsudake]